MNDPVNDADYVDDVSDDQQEADDLGPTADPAQVPPDEGDAGQAQVIT